MITIQTENNIAFEIALQVHAAAHILRAAQIQLEEECRTMNGLMNVSVIPNPKNVTQFAAVINEQVTILRKLKQLGEFAGLSEDQFDVLVSIPDSLPTFH